MCSRRSIFYRYNFSWICPFILHHRGSMPVDQTTLQIFAPRDLSRNLRSLAILQRITLASFEPLEIGMEVYEYQASDNNKCPYSIPQSVDWAAITRINVFPGRGFKPFASPGTLRVDQVTAPSAKQCLFTMMQRLSYCPSQTKPAR